MLCVRVLGSCPYKFLSVLVLSVHSGMEQRGIIEACTSYNEIYTVYRYSLLYIMMLYMLFSQGGGVVIGMHIVCVFMSLCECVCVHECVGLCVGKPSTAALKSRHFRQIQQPSFQSIHHEVLFCT